MKKIESTLTNMLLSLGLITGVAALLLGGVYALTATTIADAELKSQVNAISEVVPEFDNNPLDEKYIYIANKGTNDSLIIEVYPARLKGKLVGAAVKSLSKNGFSGEVVVMCGFLENGIISNYKVLRHTETAGLGSKMQEWFRMTDGNRNVIGMNPGVDDMRVKKDGGMVDGITAATISSRAFLGALNDAYMAYKEMQEKEARNNE